MSFFCPPNTDTTVHGVLQLDSISNEICDSLYNLRKNIKPISAKVGNQNGAYEVVSTIRDVMAYPIGTNHPSVALSNEIISKIVAEANETFNYNLTGMIESCALLKYTSPSHGYDWHVDIANGTESLRKISIIINLNDKYEGGDFEMFSEGVSSISFQKGDVIAFSSFLPHRITPITKGERWSLVAWVSGPCFR
tara:strand:- start:1445 stop:2026 length:582 start_codon:yes stop_codon:yes gene_type:complete